MEKITVHSYESLAALDGPGIRFAVFLAGCPLRCAYCHNPDTWDINNGQEYTIEEIVAKAKRYIPYYKNDGGITFSGGEPLLWAKQLSSALDVLKKENIHTAIDTAGSIINQDVKDMLRKKPMILLDVKMPDEARYNKYIKGSLKTSLEFLKLANDNGCKIWLRYVVLPTINDTEEDVKKICEIANLYNNVIKIELLPYHTMGVDKYKKLGIDYPLKGLLAPSAKSMEKLNKVVENYFNNNGCGV